MTIHQVPVADLVDHPENRGIYGDEDPPQDLVESILDNGVIAPLICRRVDDGDHFVFRIISGHRRRRAAQIAGLETVPVVLRSFDSDDEELVALIESNHQRDKNEAQVVAELERLEPALRDLANRRQLQGVATLSPIGDKVGESGKTHEQLAARLGIAPRRVERLMTVFSARVDGAFRAELATSVTDSSRINVYDDLLADVRRRRLDDDISLSAAEREVRTLREEMRELARGKKKVASKGKGKKINTGPFHVVGYDHKSFQCVDERNVKGERVLVGYAPQLTEAGQPDWGQLYPAVAVRNRIVVLSWDRLIGMAMPVVKDLPKQSQPMGVPAEHLVAHTPLEEAIDGDI